MAWRRWGILPLLVGSVVLAFAWDLTRGGPSYGDYGLALGGEHALPSRLVQFVAGMACAYWVVRRGSLPLWASSALALVSLLLAVLASSTDQSAATRHLVWAAVGVGLVLLTSSVARLHDYPPTTEAFGERAYSFYLLHQPIVLMWGPLMARLPGWELQLLVGSAAALSLTTVGALVMYRWVELPTHRLGRRLFPSPTRLDATSPAPTSSP